MTSRKARKRTAERPAPPTAVEDFPELALVVQGYLHEDYAVEHGSAHQAVAAYRCDASDEERTRFDREVERFLRLVDGATITAIRKILVQEFGSAWAPRSLAELRNVLRAPA
ncbi:MAG: hypothetical protein GEU99_06750 [Luteitalea sp.]|nr:hypothetical protein [Luteitalea sp.]